MSSARDRILGRLKNAPRLSVPLRAQDPELLIRLTGIEKRHLAETFTAAIKSSHAEVFRCTPDTWVEEFRSLCRHRDWKTVLFSRDFSLPANNGDWRFFDSPIESHKAKLFDGIDVGVVRASCGIADTGSLVLVSGPKSPRTLSLVPPVNVCILDAKRLYTNLPTALAGEAWASAMPSNLIFISGPSKTADIQQTLAYGAHGPKELVVFLIDTPLEAGGRS